MTTHEEEQFEFQDQRDLMTLGWVGDFSLVDILPCKTANEYDRG